jgi:sec-independent protein translocase protein TatA
MLGNAFGWPHLLIILVILLLLFGAPKLPALAKSITQSLKIFKTEMGPSTNGSSAAPKSSDGTDATPPASSTDYPPKL